MNNNGGGIKYIRHQEIDTAKWDNCIENALNSRLYANHWHLDRAAVVWDALVYGDYEFVMPLPFRKKWGINYVYQPLFCQQLGIFPSPPVEIAKMFYAQVRKNFRFSDVQLNAQNQPVSMRSDIVFLPRKNYLLALDSDYKSISSRYSKNTARNVAKARTNGLNYVAGISMEEYMDFKIKNLQVDPGKKELAKLKSIIAYGQYKGIGEISGVYTSENKLCAAVYFCRWRERIIYLNAATSDEGKEVGGMFFLLDSFLKSSAGTNLILDLEGSMIPGVARFYKGFGASPETYHQLKFNRLPLPLKWLKRK